MRYFDNNFIMMISGIDEAGKGPVLGPMCVAGVLMEEDRLTILKRMGVRDSKSLSPARRHILAENIRRIASNYYILEVSPLQIDELRKIMTMNEIMVVCFARVLEELKPQHAYVDASDVLAKRFGENIRSKYPGEITITSEHNADERYPIVSAASILAKSKRDMLIKQLEYNMGMEIGSGYPADHRTISFLENWIKEHGELPDIARSSWKTSINMLGKHAMNEEETYG